MTRRLALIWLGATAVVSAIVGFISYGAGWASGAAAKLPQGAAAVGPYYGGYGPHFFGFFGFLPFLFILCCLFFFFRIGRWRRPWGGGWGYPGYGAPYQQSAPPPPPPAGDPWQGWPQRPQQPATPPEQEKPAQ